MLSRRRFVQGLSIAGAAAGVGLPGLAVSAPANKTVLSGDTFDLVIGPTPVNITGRPVIATGINDLTPGPVLRWREGQTVTLNVLNRLQVPTSIHWHGIRVPSAMDGVPGLSFRGIAPGERFTYRIPLHQSGTYWYHSHSMFQEQTGLYGAIIIAPDDKDPFASDRDYVVLLSDWSDTDPDTIVSNLKFQSDYYNHAQRTAGTLIADAGKHGLAAALSDRLEWGRMRMSPTDIADVTGSTYTYLLNGQGPAANWTGIFSPGERVRLRFINASSMTFFDVRIPGLGLSVVQADGNDVIPVMVDEFRIGVAETYDVIVHPQEDRAYTIFAQAEDRSGYARGTLATRAGVSGVVPAMDARPVRTMTDMGMGGMDMAAGKAATAPSSMAGMDMPGMKMPGMKMDGGNPSPPRMDMTADAKPAGFAGTPGVDNVAIMPVSRLDEPGDGLEGNGRRVLCYADLRATIPGDDPRPASRDIELHLTGNMERYIWGFDGKKFSEAGPIQLKKGERVRFVLINDTMMEHPIHLHGLWSELENGHGRYRPYKHTIIVKPGEKLSYLVTADEPGSWAYHCHLLYHMEMGMFRTVVVA